MLDETDIMGLPGFYYEPFFSQTPQALCHTVLSNMQSLPNLCDRGESLMCTGKDLHIESTKPDCEIPPWFVYTRDCIS